MSLSDFLQAGAGGFFLPSLSSQRHQGRYRQHKETNGWKMEASAVHHYCIASKIEQSTATAIQPHIPRRFGSVSPALAFRDLVFSVGLVPWLFFIEGRKRIGQRTSFFSPKELLSTPLLPISPIHSWRVNPNPVSPVGLRLAPRLAKGH